MTQREEFDIRGKLAASLKCWHRLTGEEAAELVALFAAQAAQPAQPEGWKLVPVKPTEEMLYEAQDQHIMPPRMKRLWKLLLSAAPSTKEPAQPVGINGLTDAETSASMSVMGLSKPKVAQPAQPGWLPIESAPKDGTNLIVMYTHINTQIVHNAFWIGEEDTEYMEDIGWWSYDKSEVGRVLLSGWMTPTHWMPLPAAPSTKEDE